MARPSVALRCSSSASASVGISFILATNGATMLNNNARTLSGHDAHIALCSLTWQAVLLIPCRDLPAAT